MKILIAGCGYFGTVLAHRFMDKGHQVWGLRRRPAALLSSGLQPVAADLLDPQTLKALPKADALVLCQAKSRPEDSYLKTYVEGTANLLDAVSGQKPGAILFISSTGVYARRDGAWVDETTDPVADGTPEEDSLCLLQAEKRVLSVPGGRVVRLAGIYGPGRNRIEALRLGRLTPQLTDAWVNRIRVEDAAAAAETVLFKGGPGQVYLGVDDAPSTQRAFYEWLCPKIGVPPAESVAPEPRAARVSNKRCSNAKLKALGWSPRYPSFKEGYTDLLTVSPLSEPAA